MGYQAFHVLSVPVETFAIALPRFRDRLAVLMRKSGRMEMDPGWSCGFKLSQPSVDLVRQRWEANGLHDELLVRLRAAYL